MKDMLKRIISVVSIAAITFTVPLSNIVSASGNNLTNAPIIQTDSGDKVFQFELAKSGGTESGIVEVVEGTNENWTKLKITQGDRVDLLEKANIEGIETIQITNIEGDVGDYHTVKTVDNEVLLDNEVVGSRNETQQLRKADALSTQTTWYVDRHITGSLNTDYAILSILISVATSALSWPIGSIIAIFTGVYQLNIPYTWYDELVLSDHAPYHWTTWTTYRTFSDALMTLQTGYDTYYQ